MTPPTSLDELLPLLQELRAALLRYREEPEGYLLERRETLLPIPRDVHLGPSTANPYVGPPPPLWASLPVRRPHEGPFDWIGRCGAAAVEAALSMLLTEEDGWDITAIHGPPGRPPGWRLRRVGKDEVIDLYPSSLVAASPRNHDDA